MRQLSYCILKKYSECLQYGGIVIANKKLFKKNPICITFKKLAGCLLPTILTVIW